MTYRNEKRGATDEEIVTGIGRSLKPRKVKLDVLKFFLLGLNRAVTCKIVRDVDDSVVL